MINKEIRKPEGWFQKKLGEVAKLDRQNIKPEFISSGTLYIGLEHINNDGGFNDFQLVEPGELASNKFSFTKNHILYGKLRPYLKKIARPDFSGICSTDIIPILPSQEIDKDFLFYCLRQPQYIDLATTRSSGANLPRISPKELEKFPIVFPPIAEQKRIAAILDKADAVRRKRREAIRLTEELLRSTFLEMFGDPVTNPKSWDVVNLQKTFQHKPQIGTTTPASEDGIYRVVRVGELGGSNVRIEKCAKINVSEADFLKFQCVPGNFLLARAIGSESHLGKSSIMQANANNVIFDSHVMRLRFSPQKVLPEFFEIWLKTKGGRSLFMKEAGRTAVQFNFNATQISRIKIPLPPIEKQRVFCRFINKIPCLSKSKTRA